MKRINHAAKFFVLLLLLCSCGDTQNNNSILGNWYGTEWLVNEKPSATKASDISFSFNDKGEYTYVNAGEAEKGTYKVENDMLFTTPANEQEIMVKIAKLTKDSLVFDMNRGGQGERLTLVKK